MNFKVIQINHSDISGGAARAAYRIHHCLRDAGIDSSMWVNNALAGDWTVKKPETYQERLKNSFRGHVGRQIVRMLKTENPIIHSPAVLSSQLVNRINASDADIVHLHWVAGEMLSIADIGHIKKPIVWMLHDMWAFCGAEHYTDDFRWREGYRSDNRPNYESGFDLNRWTWERKRKHWLRPMQIVTPSRWLAECVQQSSLMQGWPVTIIPNTIDVEKWKPLPKTLARSLLGLPVDVPLLLFGAMGGGIDPRKGYDLLLDALSCVRESGQARGLELVVFGQLQPKNVPDFGFPIHYTGHLHDDLSLRALYCAADIMIVPSRQEAFGQTASEAHACGTPVVAFNNSGLTDIVQHCTTGYLASPFDPEDLARGILWIMSDQQRYADLSSHARDYAVEHFSNSLVVAKHKSLYERVLSTR